MKPRIKIYRNTRGERKWACTGIPANKNYEIFSLGDTPRQAFIAWLDDCDLSF